MSRQADKRWISWEATPAELEALSRAAKASRRSRAKMAGVILADGLRLLGLLTPEGELVETAAPAQRTP